MNRQNMDETVTRYNIILERSWGRPERLMSGNSDIGDNQLFGTHT